jgi:hypothetical protein
MKEDKIKPLALKLMQKRKELENKTEELKDLKKVHVLEVLELSKDKSNGLTNQTLRDAEVESRLGLEQDYQLIKSVVDALTTEIQILQIDLEHERNAFKVWEIEQWREIKGLN